jgi:hypothetical protein
MAAKLTLENCQQSENNPMLRELFHCGSDMAAQHGGG